MARATAATLPGIAVGWESFLLYAVAARFLAVSPVVYAVLLGPPLLLAVTFVEPLLAVLSAVAGPMVSSRTNDPRISQSVGGLLVMPVIALLPAQIAGAFTLGVGTILLAALGIALLDGLLMYFAARIFQRETILTRWR